MQQRSEAEEGSQKKEECSILKLSKIKSRCRRYDTSQDSKSKQKISMTSVQCEVHGAIHPRESQIDLNNPKKFISFICFLIQFKFKLLNIEDINQDEKDR
jgi:hypothetical protein